MTTVADNRFDNLFSELMSKCNLSREKLSELIEQKKANVGGGYLTEQGALFLVAGDLGVVMDYDDRKLASLDGLSKEQSSVTITCRMISLGYPKLFTRKSDSQRGLLSRALIYDNSRLMTLSLWDRASLSLIEGLDLRPGDLIKISNAYCRTALDGSPALNAGDRAVIEKISDERNSATIKNLQEKIQRLSLIPENGTMLIIRGRVVGEIRKTNYTRSDGNSSDLTAFTICDLEDSSVKHRVVIWGNPNPVFTSLKDSEVVTLLNVRTKLSNFQNTVSVEIHGDETTCILERWDETKKWMEELARNYHVETDKQASVRTDPARPIPFIARIISMQQSDDARAYLLLVDSQKRKISVNASGGALKDLEQLTKDDVLVCKPETFDTEGLRTSAIREKSLVKSVSKRSDIPMSFSLLTTIEKLGQTGVVSLELMCLTDPIAREIQTKDGLVKRTEITVADHTGEIKVYGWRNISRMLEDFSAGDRIDLGAVEVQTHEAKKFLTLKNYSTVTKRAS